MLSIFFIKKKTVLITSVTILLPKCLALVVEKSYHQYKEFTNEMPIKALLPNDFLNASSQQRKW